MLKKEGQSALEFIIIIGVVTFFFLGFAFVLQMNLADKNWENKNLITKEIALAVQNEIKLASESIDGYRREFQVPQNIAGIDYSINIISGLIYINSTDNQHALALPVANVTGNVQKGNNVIRRDSGMVYLNS